MNKKFFMAMMILFVSAVLFACGGKEETSSSISSSSSSSSSTTTKTEAKTETKTEAKVEEKKEEVKAEPVVLKIMGYADNATGEIVDWENALDAFSAMYPEVTLEVETLYDEPYHQKATARVQSGDVPHVAYMWPGSRSSYFDPVETDIRPYINMDDYAPAAMAPQGPNGELYMLPTGLTNTSVFYVNTAILDKYGFDMPETYADLVAMVEPLKADGIDVIAMANKDTWVMNSCLLGTLVGRYAGESDWISQAVAGEHNFAEGPFVQALEMIQTMYQDGVLPPTSIQTDYGTVASNFLSGKAAFLLDGDWRAGIFVDAETKEDLPIVDDLAMMSFPAVPGEKANMAGSSSVVQAVGYGMTKAALRDPAVTEAAANFMKYMGGVEQSTQRFNSFGQIPAIKMDLPTDASESTKMRAAHVNSVPAISNVVDNFVGGTPNNKLNENLQKLGLGTVTPQQVADQLEKDIRAEQ